MYHLITYIVLPFLAILSVSASKLNYGLFDDFTGELENGGFNNALPKIHQCLIYGTVRKVPVSVIDWVISHGYADVNATDDKGFTSLFNAAIANDLEAVKELIKHKAEYCNQVLANCVHRGRFGVAKVLLEHFSRQISADELSSALQSAISLNSFEMLETIFRLANPDVNYIDSNKETIFLCALRRCDVDLKIIEFLIEKGASLDQVDIYGTNVLKIAADAAQRSRRFDVVFYLLEKVGDLAGKMLEAKNERGNSAFDTLSAHAPMDILEEIVSRANL